MIENKSKIIPIILSDIPPSTNKYNSSEVILHRKSISKILLIQPPAFANNYRSDMNANAPLGLAYIAAVLERDGFLVKILDAFIEGFDQEERISSDKIRIGLNNNQIEEIIREFNPDAVGVTSMFTSQRKNAHAMASIVKSIDPRIPVIFGGAHATSASEEVLNDRNVDVVVLGEGENVITEIIKCIENNLSLSTIDGISYRDCNGKYVEISKVSIIDNLDEIPFPARHLLPMEKYFAAKIRHGGESKNYRTASMITSRGCQYLCNFCTAFKVFTRKPRMRSIENVLAEIDSLIDTYQIQEIFFEDDQIIAKQKRAIQLFEAIAQRHNLDWDTPNGVSPWLLNDEILLAMKNAGCYRINLAIESGNQFVLDKIINKPVKLNKIPDLVSKIKSLGMDVSTFLVVGNFSDEYVETIDQMKESYSFCRSLGVKTHVSLLTAYPGSDVLEVAIRKNYLVDNFNWDDLIIQKSQIKTELWSPDDIVRLVRRENLLNRMIEIRQRPLHNINILLKRFFNNPIGYFRKVFDAYKIYFNRV